MYNISVYSNSKNKLPLILGLSISLPLAAIIIVILVIIFYKKRMGKKTENSWSNSVEFFTKDKDSDKDFETIIDKEIKTAHNYHNEMCGADDDPFENSFFSTDSS